MSHKKWCTALAALWMLSGGTIWAEQTAHGNGQGAGVETAGQPAAAGEKAKDAAGDEALFPIGVTPLADQDFTIKGWSLGTRWEEAAVSMGTPLAQENGPVRSETKWQDLSVRVVNEVPYAYMNRDDVTLSKNFITGGIDAFVVTGPSIQTARGIQVGNRRENVLRAYGKPAEILWDGKAACTYLVYTHENRMLVFTIRKNKVREIRVSYMDSSFSSAPENRDSADARARFRDREFRLAGYALGETFRERSWMIWEKKAMNPEEEVWYYPGFAVRMGTEGKEIHSVFLTGADMLTGRGISIGDDQSTLEAVYGAPEKVEQNSIDGAPQVVYIYFSQNKKQVLLFYINEKSRKIDHIIVMYNPQAKGSLAKMADEIRSLREKRQAAGNG